MSQSMSLTSSLLNLGAGSSSGTKYNSGYISKLPSLPKDENMFGIWKLKVEAIIRGAGFSEILEYDNERLMLKAIDSINLYRKEREEFKDQPGVKELILEQVDNLRVKSYRVYAALAETLVTADQMRILLNKRSVP